jgi:hypothetical protein
MGDRRQPMTERTARKRVIGYPPHSASTGFQFVAMAALNDHEPRSSRSPSVPPDVAAAGPKVREEAA